MRDSKYNARFFLKWSDHGMKETTVWAFSDYIKKYLFLSTPVEYHFVVTLYEFSKQPTGAMLDQLWENVQIPEDAMVAKFLWSMAFIKPFN